MPLIHGQAFLLLDRSMIWSLYERQTGITAEVTTTNPIESFFSRLRKLVNNKMKLKDATSNLNEGIASKNSISIVKDVEEIPESVKEWKLDYQKLILDEYLKGKEIVSNGKLDLLFCQAVSNGTCRCKFYRFNQMPCQHVLSRNIEMNGDFLDGEQWNELKERFQ
ncbi:hypothetical protein MP638_004336 [Amoeboaphelidium occidentale]|nr:hypothetical protein MP638_004336 [Amoeboaphelidium occidentale]